MVSPQFKSGLGCLVLRLGMAGIFMSHGALKIQATGGTTWFDIPGVMLPGWVQLIVAWTELACGALLLVGLLTRAAAVLLVLEQVGAIWLVTWKKELIDTSTMPAGAAPNSMANQVGWEYNMALIAMGFALFILGGGMIALDHFLFGRGKAAPPKALEPTPAPTVAR
jgi:putative oxidoreductase